METNTNTAVIENTDGEMTPKEHVTKLLWWMFGITSVNLLRHLAEFTGNYQSLPIQLIGIISFVIPAAEAIVLFLLGKYGKLFRLSGIIMGVSAIARVVAAFALQFNSSGSTPNDFLGYLNMISGNSNPTYRFFNGLSTTSSFVGFILMCVAFLLFIKPLSHKLGKWWIIPIILHIASYLIPNIVNTVQLFFPTNPNTDLLTRIYIFFSALSGILVFVNILLRTILLFITIKKFNANQAENEPVTEA